MNMTKWKQIELTKHSGKEDQPPQPVYLFILFCNIC